MEPKAQNDPLSEFLKLHPRLFVIAYRMVGSAADAEDKRTLANWSPELGDVFQTGVARVSSTEQRRLVEAFIAAAEKGDMPALENLFGADVVSHSDGAGGVVLSSAHSSCWSRACR